MRFHPSMILCALFFGACVLGLAAVRREVRERDEQWRRIIPTLPVMSPEAVARCSVCGAGTSDITIRCVDRGEPSERYEVRCWHCGHEWACRPPNQPAEAR